MTLSPDDAARSRNDDQLDRDMARTVRDSGRHVWATVVILGVMVLALTGTVGYLLAAGNQYSSEISQRVTDSQRVQDQRWCTALGQLVSQSGAAASPLYAGFRELLSEFGCY